MSCSNSSSSKCNPCGPSESAMNAIADRSAYYARISQYNADAFSQVYLGAKDIAPTVDNNGNPLIEGALYFDTVNELLYAWDGTAWVSAIVGANTVTTNTPQTITGQKTFTQNVLGNLTGNVTGNVTGNITGNVTGTVTGAASLNVLKSGDTMTGPLVVPAGATGSQVPRASETVKRNGDTLSGEYVIQTLFSTTSTTSLTIGVGSQTLTVGAGLDWTSGRAIKITNTASSSRYMSGTVTSYASSTGSMVVNVITIGSSGTYASWTVTQESSTALPTLRITSNDTANAFVVEDSTNPDSTPFVITSSGNVGVGISPTITGLEVSGTTKSKFYDTRQGPSFNGAYCFQYGRGIEGFGSYKISFPFYANGQTSTIDLFNEFADPVFSGGMLAQALYGSTANTGLFLRCFVSTAVIATTIATGFQQVTKGNYVGDICINSLMTGSSTGWGINGVGATTSATISTASGVAQTIGGVPFINAIAGYIGFTATRETVSADGTINLVAKGHTTADDAITSYQSFVNLRIDLMVN